jgi:hypothetical protein
VTSLLPDNGCPWASTPIPKKYWSLCPGKWNELSKSSFKHTLAIAIFKKIVL